MEIDFTHRRAGTLSRIAGYTFLLVFLVNLLAILLPPPFLEPERSFAALVEVVERSTLPLVAVLFLFLGFSGESHPALWECRLARWMRPLLLLVAVVYLITTLAFPLAAQRIDRSGIASSQAQIDRVKQEFQQLRDLLASGPDDTEAVGRVLSAQPALAQALSQQLGDSWDQLSPPQRRQRVEQLIDTSEVNANREAVAARANASGHLRKRTVLFSLTALFYALYYLAAHLIWPRSLAATRQRILQAREARLAEESAAEAS